MHNAFWSLLEETDYDKITVTTIVNRAKVNRNSFYYHYESLADLAQTVIQEAIDNLTEAFPELVEDPGESWRRIVTQLLGVPSNRIHVDHIALTVSSRTNPFLITSLHTSIREALVKAQHLNSQSLQLTSDVLLEFTTGGLMALIGMWPHLSDTVTLEELATVDGDVLARALYLSISSNNPSGFWTRLFNTTIKQQDRSSVKALAQVEQEDQSFKQQVEALLARTNAEREHDAWVDSRNHNKNAANDDGKEPHTSEGRS